MTTTQQAITDEQIRDIWTKGLPEETAFWKKWFETKGFGFPGYAWRTDPNYEFQQNLRQYLNVPEGGTIRVLDVGAGPLTVLGKVWPSRKLDIVAVDPLAEKYDKIMAELGVTPLVRTCMGHGERLLDIFPPESFDLVYAENSLDHSYNPLLCLRQMFAIVKPGCYIVTDHLINEAKAENYHGLHQWNFTIERWPFFWRPARFVIWRPGIRLDVQEQLGEFAKVEVTYGKAIYGSRAHVYASIKKLASAIEETTV